MSDTYSDASKLAKVSQLTALTGVDSGRARVYLESAKWEFENAVQLYYDKADVLNSGEFKVATNDSKNEVKLKKQVNSSTAILENEDPKLEGLKLNSNSSNTDKYSKYCSLLQQLHSDPNIPSCKLRECLESLIKIYRNVQDHPNEDKYRKIKISNPRFNANVWKYEPARRFLVETGWTSEVDLEDTLAQVIRLDSRINDKDSLKALIEHRNVLPNREEWVEENKIVIENAMKKKEKEMRIQAALERKKDLEKFEKEKKERQEIAANIKKEIKDDNVYRKDVIRKYVDKPLVRVDAVESRRTAQTVTPEDPKDDQTSDDNQ